MQLHQGYERFRERGAEIVVVGPDDAESFRTLWNKEGYRFIGIPDPEHEILKRYGQKVDLFKLGRMPAQMLVDREGVLRYVHYGHSMKDIPENEELFSLLERL